jgi:P-type conjugative transfer protein VirB9
VKRLIHLAGFVALVAAPALAEDTPRAGPADQRVKFVEYQETQVYRIVGTFRTATQVVLGADETIEHVALGDTVSWEVAVAGHILFLKPRERAGPTNLIVTTNRGGELRNYAFELTTRRGPIGRGSSNTFFQVRFRYPRDEADRAARMRATQEAQRVAALQASVVRGALDHGVIEGPRNLNYKVCASQATMRFRRSTLFGRMARKAWSRSMCETNSLWCMPLRLNSDCAVTERCCASIIWHRPLTVSTTAPTLRRRMSSAPFKTRRSERDGRICA